MVLSCRTAHTRHSDGLKQAGVTLRLLKADYKDFVHVSICTVKEHQLPKRPFCSWTTLEKVLFTQILFILFSLYYKGTNIWWDRRVWRDVCACFSSRLQHVEDRGLHKHSLKASLFLHFAFLLHNPESLFYQVTRVIIFFYIKCVKYVVVYWKLTESLKCIYY